MTKALIAKYKTQITTRFTFRVTRNSTAHSRMHPARKHSPPMIWICLIRLTGDRAKCANNFTFHIIVRLSWTERLPGVRRIPRNGLALEFGKAVLCRNFPMPRDMSVWYYTCTCPNRYTEAYLLAHCPWPV